MAGRQLGRRLLTPGIVDVDVALLGEAVDVPEPIAARARLRVESALQAGKIDKEDADDLLAEYLSESIQIRPEWNLPDWRGARSHSWQIDGDRQ